MTHYEIRWHDDLLTKHLNHFTKCDEDNVKQVNLSWLWLEFRANSHRKTKQTNK